MATLIDESKTYEPKTVKNIADLEEVNPTAEVHLEESVNDDGKPYSFRYILINDEKYRVPASVLGELKEILKVKPDLQKFKVSKTGSGLNTKYKVIQL